VAGDERDLMRRYGWIKSPKDDRDYLLKAPSASLVESLPAKVDLRPVPEVYNQADMNACVAHATVAAMRLTDRKEKTVDTNPSRLYVYYRARQICGDVSKDGGSTLRAGMQAVASYGAPDERDWPYIPQNLFVEPSSQLDEEAKNDVVTAYAAVEQNLELMKSCLVSGYPFVLGVTVFESMESEEVARTGILPMPASNEKRLGGHALCCVGYSDARKSFLIQNSWGTDWGLGGFFWMPYEYVLNDQLVSDFWTIRTIAVKDQTESFVVPKK
jgi:C1A family cysteine protease